MGQNRLRKYHSFARLLSSPKGVVFTIALVLCGAMSVSGCVPSAQAVLSEVLSFDEGIAARVERVQQYEDRMPTTIEEGEPAPKTKWVTLIDVEVEACPGAETEDFELALKDSERAILIQIRSVGEVPVCLQKTRHFFSFSTSEILPGRHLVIANPLPIDALGPAD